MSRDDEPIRRLTRELTRLPGIGEKSAQRLAYAVVGMSARDARSIASAIIEVKEKITSCSVCFDFSPTDPCRICTDAKRDASVVCVVEDPRDLRALEKAGSYRGLYHVLHGVISPMSGTGPGELRIQELVARVKEHNVKEIIIATNPTKEGEVTAHYIQDALSGISISISRIAQGIPAGGDLEYFDPATLQAALNNRREM
ncbi:MAG: recombination protein RecR [Deltaproteobacteria bacterium]|nr:recombination protein RecR [Candidatus Zymogenaceae bacterium]